MDKNNFIGLIKEGALKGQQKFRILPSLTMAQAILESGWGTSELSVKANNLFGIKAFSDWTGSKITFPTTEWYEDQARDINADFRAYDSFNDSIEDHNKLLSCSRYKTVRGCTTYAEACCAVYECGYATDPEYAEKLIRIIEENRLYEFNSMQKQKEAAITSDEGKILKFQHPCNLLNIRDYDDRTLIEDKILGPRTRSCIAKMPMLMEVTRGETVVFIQEMFKAKPVDGDFGPVTRAFVMEFQRLKGIFVDGIVGRETWNVIVTT